jgi:acetyl-CoA C-acetyltransferase
MYWLRLLLSHSQHPSEFTIAPISAIQKVLDPGWSVEDVDVGNQ